MQKLMTSKYCKFIENEIKLDRNKCNLVPLGTIDFFPPFFEKKSKHIIYFVSVYIYR